MIVHRLHNEKLPWDEKLCPSFNSIMRSYVNKMILWEKCSCPSDLHEYELLSYAHVYTM